jgi:hypothetical protein
MSDVSNDSNLLGELKFDVSIDSSKVVITQLDVENAPYDVRDIIANFDYSSPLWTELRAMSGTVIQFSHRMNALTDQRREYLREDVRALMADM